MAHNSRSIMASKNFNLIVKKKIQSFEKKIEVDSDKSISIRSFLIGSISENISSAKNVLESEDVLSTINCLKSLGVKIIKKKPKEYLIFGKGLGSLAAKKGAVLNFGNSGTLARLLIGLLSTTPNDNTSSISVDTTISLTFSEVMDNSTLIVNSDNTSCAGSVRLSSDNFSNCIRFADNRSTSDNTTFVFFPRDNLSDNTTYKIKVTTGLEKEKTLSASFLVDADVVERGRFRQSAEML